MNVSVNTITKLRADLDKGITNSDKLFESAIKKAHKYQDKYNIFVTIMDKKIEEKSDSILSSIPYALKDNISTKKILTTASSNLLKNTSVLILF